MIKPKSMSPRLGFVVPLIFLVWLSTSRNAHAYIDPGAGSYIFQILVASLLAALFFLKTFWQRVKAFFATRSSEIPKNGPRAVADDLAGAPGNQTPEVQGSSNESDRNDA